MLEIVSPLARGTLLDGLSAVGMILKLVAIKQSVVMHYHLTELVYPNPKPI